MSRPRLRSSLLEINYQACNNCGGSGLVRSLESQALQIIRNLNLMLKTLEKKVINLKISSAMSQYLLNYKYDFIKSKKIDNNIVKITVDNSFELNKFYIIAENNIDKKEDEGSIEKINKGNNKKLNTK